MLRIYSDMLEAVRLMRGVVAAIEKRDADLARQLKRAASSVALNLAEGSGSAGGMRMARYRTALGSARARPSRVSRPQRRGATCGLCPTGSSRG